MYHFTDDCLIGVEEIDNEHRELFRIINETQELLDNQILNDKYDRILETVERLEQYAEAHFRHEEAYMESIRHPELSVQKKERSQFIQDRQGEFQLNEMLLQLADERPEFENVERIEVCRLEDGGTVEFEGILNEEGERRKIRCSNVRIHVETKG